MQRVPLHCENIAIVPQDTVLFNDTLLHNLRYGRSTATEEEVQKVGKGPCRGPVQLLHAVAM
jgi:ABC-type transport system involved in Fe-S cluster assembly fused permease/ATPase subunit